MDVDQLLDSINNCTTNTPEDEWENVIKSIEIFESIMRNHITNIDEIRAILDKYYYTIKRYITSFIDNDFETDNYYYTEIKSFSHSYVDYYEKQPKPLSIEACKRLVKLGLYLFYCIHDSYHMIHGDKVEDLKIPFNEEAQLDILFSTFTI